MLIRVKNEKSFITSGPGLKRTTVCPVKIKPQQFNIVRSWFTGVHRLFVCFKLKKIEKQLQFLSENNCPF